MDKPDLLPIAHEWFRFADMDLTTSETMINHYPQPFEVVCYHCQQCAEKYLKAFVILNGERPDRTHNLNALLQKCRQWDNDFKEIQKECFELNRFGILPRYPFEIEIIETDAKLAIKYAKKVKDFIRNKA